MRARPEIEASIHAAGCQHASTGQAIARLFYATSRAATRMSATRANSWAGLVADVTVSIALLWLGLRRYDSHVASALGAILCGLLAFSFVEYAFHRWLFHGRVRVMEEGHRKHHDEPRGYDSLPFFVAPLLMLALAAALACVVPTTTALLSAGALASGYAAYGSGHLAIHFVRFRHPLPRRWAAAHHVHHFHPDTNFGVTSPLWDILLGTRYMSSSKREIS
ncbi:MAG: sterol desaturase family protein [Rhodanobacteraceae bacterium]